ncbi:hypothetical protein PE067_20550 [Paracoccus sp. DMF-8]|nr:hypothetical protein [Paracoccus sp. DMF-8]MDF3608322.1 hypothetical protein [Paracoccus sp. DMF-8]
MTGARRGWSFTCGFWSLLRPERDHNARIRQHLWRCGNDFGV